MQKYSQKITFLITIIALLASFLTACGTKTTEEVQETKPKITSSPIPPTRTPFPPTPTPIPVAAVVNGDTILVEEYQAELARYQMTLDRELTEEDKEIVINDLINLTLLAQAAHSAGFDLSEEALQSRIEELDSGEQPLDDWLATYGYSEESFQRSLARSMAAAWMRDEILAEVPETAEQVHAQQMLYYTEAEVNYAIGQLEAGIDFAQLAATHDPQTKGNLGWFPRGYLTIPKIDETVFNLEVGDYSDIIETEIGFHIIKVIEKEENRPLPLDILNVLKEKALHNWLERRWKLSTIEITLP